MTEQEVIALLEEVGAVTHGHFLLSSGRHSDTYVEKFRALERPDAAQRLGEAIAKMFTDRGVDVVLSPAVGGIVIGFATALALGSRFVFAERKDAQMSLRRGFSIAPGERVLVVDDIYTTGTSVNEVLPLVDPGELVGIGLIVDRSSSGIPQDAQALARIEAPSWSSDDCPLCRDGGNPESPGSRFH